MTCTVEITLHALSQRSPAEGKGKGRAISVSNLAFRACCLYGLLITQYALL